MPIYDLNGWPVDFRKLPSWARRDDKIISDDAIFRFFRRPLWKTRRQAIRTQKRAAVVMV